MRLPSLLVLLLAAPTIAGAQAYHPKISVDEFTKWRTVTVDLGNQACDHDYVRADVWVVGSSKGTSRSVLFEITTYSESWIFQGDTPAEVKLDSTAMELGVAEAPDRAVRPGLGNVRETGNFAITPERLSDLASAGRVRARVDGKQGECTISLSSRQQALIRAFLHAEYPRVQVTGRYAAVR